jgi:hypothetical protein
MLNDDNGMQELTIPVILLHETEYSPAHLGPRSVPYLGYGSIRNVPSTFVHGAVGSPS